MCAKVCKISQQLQPKLCRGISVQRLVKKNSIFSYMITRSRLCALCQLVSKMDPCISCNCNVYHQSIIFQPFCPNRLSFRMCCKLILSKILQISNYAIKLYITHTFCSFLALSFTSKNYFFHLMVIEPLSQLHVRSWDGKFQQSGYQIGPFLFLREIDVRHVDYFSYKQAQMYLFTYLTLVLVSFDSPLLIKLVISNPFIKSVNIVSRGLIRLLNFTSFLSIIFV